MVGRSGYRFKKSPLDGKRKKIILIAVIATSIAVICYGLFLVFSFKPASSTKSVDKVSTGDQPLKVQTTVYVNADGGLSLRSDHESSATRLLLIPNGTKLTVEEELNGWYKVSYSNKTGWISKQYTTTAAPETDQTVSWASYSFSNGTKIKYQPGWNVQSYPSTGGGSVVAFSNQQLPSSIATGSEFVAPVMVTVVSASADAAGSSYSSIGGVVTESLVVAGVTAKKYTYTSTTSNTQVTTVVVPVGSSAMVFAEAGGYVDDLLKMLNTFTINS